MPARMSAALRSARAAGRLRRRRRPGCNPRRPMHRVCAGMPERCRSIAAKPAATGQGRSRIARRPAERTRPSSRPGMTRQRPDSATYRVPANRELRIRFARIPPVAGLALEAGARSRFDAGPTDPSRRGERRAMKITDVTLTLFAWESIPSTIYGHHTARPTGKSDLGLLADRHRRGRRGARFSRHLVEPGEPRRARPDPLSEADPDGPEPARPRAAQPAAVGARPRRDGPRDRRRRHRAVGHRRQDGRPADPPADRHLPRQDRRLCQLRDPRLASRPMSSRPSITNRPAGTPTRSTRRSAGARTSRSARRCARRSATTTRSCSISTWSYRYEEALRVGLAIQEMGFYWYEDPLAEQDLYNYVKLQAEARHPDPRHRIPDRRPRFIYPVDHSSAPPTCCAAMSRSKAASRP